MLTSLELIPLTPNGKMDRKALPAPSGQHRALPHTAPEAPTSVGLGCDESASHPRQAAAPQPANVSAPGAVSGGIGQAEAVGVCPETRRLEAGVPTSTRLLPLTEAQREIWYAAQMSDGMSCSFNQSVTFRLRGDLDANRLLRGLHQLAERHEALRMTFSRDGSAQQIHPPIAVPVPVSDLAPLPAATRQEILRQALVEAATTPFDLTQGPLWRARLLRLGAAGARAFAHHPPPGLRWRFVASVTPRTRRVSTRPMAQPDRAGRRALFWRFYLRPGSSLE